MKTKVLSLVLVSLLMGLLIACEKDNVSTTSDPQPAVGENPEPATPQKPSIEVWQFVSDYTFDDMHDTIIFYLYLKDSSSHTIIRNHSKDNTTISFDPGNAKITVNYPYLTFYYLEGPPPIRGGKYIIHSYDGTSILIESVISFEIGPVDKFLFHKIYTY